MPSPQFIESKSISLLEARESLEQIEKRDTDLNYRSKKAKEFAEHFSGSLSKAKREELRSKLLALNLTRLREDHIIKIIDFLPQTANELKVVLMAYPLTLAKKDQESIVAVVKEVVA